MDHDASVILDDMASDPMKSDGRGWIRRRASPMRINRTATSILIVEGVISIVGGAVSARLDGEAAAGAALIFIVSLTAVSYVIGTYCGNRRLLAITLLNSVVLAFGFWGSTWVFGASRGTLLGYFLTIVGTILFGSLISSVGYGRRAHLRRHSSTIKRTIA